MKRLILLLLATLFVATGFAQTPTPPPAGTAPTGSTSVTLLADVLGFVVGTWEGEGVSRGEHEFVGKMTATTELEGNAILVRRESMNKAGGPSGGLQELLLIGYDGSTKKIIGTLYDNKNSILLYVGEAKDKEIVFSLATSTPGYVSRRIFRLNPDGTLVFQVEGATPGKEVSKMVEINFKKKM